LLQAAYELDRLRAAGIPVIGVTGNHERAHYRVKDSWLDYLCARGLLTLLSPRYDAEKQLLVSRFRPGAGGAFVDVGGARLYGLPYFGSLAPRLVADLAAYLAQAHASQPPVFTILIMHAGLEGILPHFNANLTLTDLQVLRPWISYLAMGHVHKPFTQDDWVFNPGSLEPVTMAEVEYRGGGLLVEVDTNAQPPIRTEPRPYWRRPFVRLFLPVTDHATPQALLDGFAGHLASQARQLAERPIVECVLGGTLQFPVTELPVSRMEQTLSEAFDALLARVRVAAGAAEYEVATGDGELGRQELERQVFSDLVKRDGRYRERAGEWVSLILETKSLALERADATSIVEHLRAGRERIAMGEPPDHADHAR